MPVLTRLLSPLAAPVRRLLDGRFADVNRRIENTRATSERQGETLAKLSRDLAAYGATQSEATAYTAHQVRLLEEAIDGQREHFDQMVDRLGSALEQLGDHGYLERLERTSSGPLSELDGGLAAAINHATGHRGFAAQAGMWLNPAVTVELAEGNARIADVNERIVELPFAFGMLARLEPPARILDIGGAESKFGISAASLGYETTVVDPQGVPFEHPNLTVIRERLEDWDAREQSFAAVFLISAIEHFGLGAYGEQSAAGRADYAAVARIRELLAPNGLLVLTTPCGPASVDELERTYDEEELEQMLAGWNVIERRTVVRQDRRTWMPGEGSGTALIAATPGTA